MLLIFPPLVGSLTTMAIDLNVVTPSIASSDKNNNVVSCNRGSEAMNKRNTLARPRIICHMLSSVDGKIDGESLRRVMPEGEYEAVGAKLKGDAWICGRTTMQQHFAEP